MRRPDSFGAMRVVRVATLALLTMCMLLSQTSTAEGAVGSISGPPPVTYAEALPDLEVKVLGGKIVIQRTFAENKWHPNYNWAPLKLTFDTIDGSVKGVTRGKTEYAKTAPGVFTFQKRDTIRQTATGFRWADRSGNWIDYDPNGNIAAYGDRNDVKVSFQYETSGTTARVAGIFDHLNRQVIWYEYTSSQLTAIRDYTNRRVQYQYTNGNLTSVIDVNGNTWTYGYTAGLPTTFTDPENRTITRAWSSNGELASIRYADGVGTDYKYEFDSSKDIFYTQEKTTGGRITETWVNSDGQVVRKDLNGKTVQTMAIDTGARNRTETDPRGLKTTREYDQWDNVTKITYPDGATVSTTYEPTFSNPTQKIDERGVITKYEYDATGNLTKFTEALGRPEQRVTEYTYDPYGNRLTMKRLGDAVTQEVLVQYGYDTKGNLTALIDPEGYRTEWSDFDALGNARTMRDARGKLWTKSYDAKGMLASQTSPSGLSNRLAYDGWGHVIKTVDAANNETRYEYDARGNLIRTVDPYGGITRSEYTPDNLLTKQTDQEGKSQSTEYDLDGRVVKQIDGSGNIIQYLYGDPTTGLDNLLAKVIYPTFTQEFKYDTRGRMIEAIDVIDASTRFSTKITYDAAGNRSAETDKENKTTNYAYDSLGRLKTVTTAGGATEYSYDNRDNNISLIDAKNQTHRFEYDRRNLKIREVRPLGQSQTFGYTPTGQLEAATDAKEQVRRFLYDDDGRKTTENYYATANDSVPVKTISYNYNRRGALTGYRDGTTQGSISYDAKEIRKTGETISYGSFDLSYGYDYFANGQIKSFVGPDGVTASYVYDANNQLSAIGLPVGNFTINQYQWNHPLRISLPGGSTRTQGYDALMRLTGINVKGGAQNEILNHQYGYDRADNLTTKSAEYGNHSFAYDSLHRLSTASNPSPLRSESYTYDAVGNRLTDSVLPGAWEYNADNQLTKVGANISFTYDSNGNMTSKANGSNVTTFIYDIADRLTEVRDGNNGLIATYYYDPFGRRLWKEVSNNRTYFFYSDEGLIAEANHNGVVTTSYGYQPGSIWTTDPVYLKKGDEYYFYQNDHLGTPQKLVARNGTVVWSAQAHAFGETIVESSSSIVNNLRLPGQYFDEETGLHYNWDRFYDPSIGRYITMDRLGTDGGINLYTYVDDNPVNRMDETGQWWQIPVLLCARFPRICKEIIRCALRPSACKKKMCAVIKKIVHPVCDAIPPCAGGEPCELTKIKLSGHATCYFLRQMTTIICYGGRGDGGHDDQMNNVLNKMSHCMRVMPLNCKCDP